MKTNPGGQLSPGEILGRQPFIARLWELLDRQSVLMTAERRIGKTCIITKMCAEPPAPWVPVYQDLERVHSTSEFALLTSPETPVVPLPKVTAPATAAPGPFAQVELRTT
jgi:hypothetical protein